MGEYKPATRKVSIRPVTLTVTVEATRINENGVFSGLTVKSVKGPNSTFKVSIPPSGGGSMFLKVEPTADNAMENIVILGDAESAVAREKVKLF